MIFAARRSTRPLSLFVAVLGLVAAPANLVLAQDKPAIGSQPRSLPPCMVFEQMQLTEAHIAGLLAAADEVNTVKDYAPGDVSNPGPETVAKLDAVAKKNGLASYDEYKTIRANAILIMSGYDSVTDRYVGREALIRLRAARVKADRKMSLEDKKDEIESLNAQRGCSLPQIAYSGNIVLFHKYSKRLWSSSFAR